MSLLDKAPCLLAVLDQQGKTLHATEKMRTELPAANEGLNAVQNNLQLDTDLSVINEAFAQGRAVQFFGRDARDTVWQLSLSFDSETGTATLIAEDVSDHYEDILRTRILLDLINKTPDYVGIARGDHTGLWVNDSMRAILNISNDELQTTTIESAHPQGLGVFSTTEALERARRDGHVCAETTLHDQKTGESVEVSLVLSAHYDPLNAEYFFSALERDISEIRATERELRQTRSELERALEHTTLTLQERESEIDYSEEVWRSLVEYSQDLVLFTDEQGTILFNNQGFLPEDYRDLRGTSALELVPGQDAEYLLMQYQELIRGEREHINAEFDCISADGAHRHCVILINRLERASGFHAATWVVSDATESHETQQLVMAQEKMAATGRMAARVAHEINNPLAAIRSSLELIRLDYQMGEPIDDTIHLMNRELDRVSNIIRQMYGLYQPERDTVQPIEITSIINDCLTLLESSARQRGISLLCNCTHGVHALASEAGLRQVLFNVLQNALDASPTHKEVFVGIQDTGDQVTVSVDDQGPGFSKYDALQIFEPFYTTKDSYSGMGLGLGLSVSSSLIKGMGGSLQLHNRPEGGTRALITLTTVSRESTSDS